MVFEVRLMSGEDLTGAAGAAVTPVQQGGGVRVQVGGGVWAAVAFRVQCPWRGREGAVE